MRGKSVQPRGSVFERSRSRTCVSQGTDFSCWKNPRILGRSPAEAPSRHIPGSLSIGEVKTAILLPSLINKKRASMSDFGVFAEADEAEREQFFSRRICDSEIAYICERNYKESTCRTGSGCFFDGSLWPCPSFSPAEISALRTSLQRAPGCDEM